MGVPVVAACREFRRSPGDTVHRSRLIRLRDRGSFALRVEPINLAARGGDDQAALDAECAAVDHEAVRLCEIRVLGQLSHRALRVDHVDGV